MLNAVGETIQVAATEPNGKRDADEGGDADQDHVVLHRAPQLAADVALQVFFNDGHHFSRSNHKIDLREMLDVASDQKRIFL